MLISTLHKLLELNQRDLNMYRLYVTTTTNGAITSKVIEFDTIRDAQIAFEKLLRHPKTSVTKLY